MENKLLSLFSFITVVIVGVCAFSLVGVGDDLTPSKSDYTKDIAIAKQNKLDEEKRNHKVETITIQSYRIPNENYSGVFESCDIFHSGKEMSMFELYQCNGQMYSYIYPLGLAYWDFDSIKNNPHCHPIDDNYYVCNVECIHATAEEHYKKLRPDLH